VLEAFNRDTPYHEFVRRQICGDLLHVDADHTQRRPHMLFDLYCDIAEQHDIALDHKEIVAGLTRNWRRSSTAAAVPQEAKS
jgi:hypothetical protein